MRLQSMLSRASFTILYNDPAAGGAGAGAGSGSSGPSTGASASPGAAPAAPGVTPPVSPGPPPPSSAAPGGTPPASQFTYAEDRSRWIPPHRLSAIAAEREALRHENARIRAMIEAGAGVRVPESARPVPPEIREAREAFAQVFPELAQLEAIAPALRQISQMLQGVDPQVFARLPEVLDTTDSGWVRQGRQTVDAIATAVAKDYGVETLSPRQRARVGNAFMQWLREEPQRVQAYSYGDARIVEEFLEEYRGDFINPLRVSSGAATIQRGQRNAQLPVPPRTSGVVPPASPPVPPATEDEVHDRAWKSFQASRG